MRHIEDEALFAWDFADVGDDDRTLTITRARPRGWVFDRAEVSSSPAAVSVRTWYAEAGLDEPGAGRCADQADRITSCSTRRWPGAR